MATALKIVHNDTLWLLFKRLHILTRITVLAAALPCIFPKANTSTEEELCL